MRCAVFLLNGVCDKKTDIRRQKTEIRNQKSDIEAVGCHLPESE